MSETKPVHETESGANHVSVARSLVPVKEKPIDFYGDEIFGLAMDDGRIFVPLKPIVDALEMDWSAQYRRLRRDAVLSEEYELIAVTAIKSRLGQPN